MNLHKTSQTALNRQAFANDSLLPLDAKAKSIARGLYEIVRDLPIISPHGHVDPKMLLANKPFHSPAELFIYFNHYVTRLLHADGVDLAKLRVPKASSDEHAREAWKELSTRMHLFAGTPSGYWFANELQLVFGISDELNAQSADRIYDQISEQLLQDSHLPQNLFKKFNIELLATTDSPGDNLQEHDQLGALDLGGRVVPTFRPDAYINPLSSGWADRVAQLIESSKQGLDQKGFIATLADRRNYFKAHGAVSVDVGAESAYTTILSDSTAQTLFEKALEGSITAVEAAEYLGHMISEMIRLSCDDGLVITLHVGVHRNHSTKTLEAFGPDSGHDLPTRAEFVKNLHPVLEKYGLNPNLHLILFALDETTWSREIAPLAGFYPSVFIGAPWWFLDAPKSARRFREATVETSGFYRGSGFIDDTRAFLSIPARHDMARRVDSAFLAELVTAGQISLSMAEQISMDLVTSIPKRVFKL